MSEMIDGWTAQRIKDFWMNPGSHNYSQHSMCKAYSEHLEKEISRLEQLKVDLWNETVELQAKLKASEEVLKKISKSECSHCFNRQRAKEALNEASEGKGG